MNRTQTFALNSLATLVHHLTVIVSGFLIPKIMLLYYGSEIFGLVTSITQFVSYFTVVEAGLATAGVYALYEPIVNKDYVKISGIVSATRKFYNTTGHLFSSLVIILALLYPIFVKVPHITPVEIGLLVVVIGSAGALDFYTMSRYRVLLTAHQKVYIISIANIIYVVLNIVLTYVCAVVSCNIIVLKIVILTSVIVRSIVLRIYVHRKYSLINHKATPDYESLKKRWDAIYLQILGAIHNGTPIILITFLCSLQEVSIYTVFNIVIAGILGLLSIISTSIFPSFGEIIASKQLSLLQKSFAKFELIYYAFLSIIITCLLFLLQKFVTLYTRDIHDANYYQPFLGFLMVLNVLFYNIKTPQGMLVIAGGLFKETRIQTTIQGLIALIAGWVGGILWGVYGIVGGIILSNIYRDIDLFHFIPKYLTKVPISDSILKFLTMCLAIILGYGVLTFINIECTTWGKWILVGIISVFISAMVTFITYFVFYKHLVKSVLTQVKSIIR